MVSPTFIRCLYAVFDYKHLLTAIYYFRRPYTTFDGDILLSTAIYYLLLLALLDCDFVSIQDIPTIPLICGLKARLEFNMILLTLIQFYFFCSSIVSFINFNSPFGKCCLIRNTQILKM